MKQEQKEIAALHEASFTRNTNKSFWATGKQIRQRGIEDSEEMFPRASKKIELNRSKRNLANFYLNNYGITISDWKIEHLTE